MISKIKEKFSHSIESLTKLITDIEDQYMGNKKN